jgi:flagellar motor switch protein FliN
MSAGLEYEELGPADGADGASLAARGAGDLRRLSAVPVDLTVEVGRARMTVGDTLELRQGSIITLNRMAGEPVDLLVNGTPIARGEVVVIDEQFGLRVTEVVGESNPGEAPRPAGIDGPDDVAAAQAGLAQD